MFSNHITFLQCDKEGKNDQQASKEQKKYALYIKSMIFYKIYLHEQAPINQLKYSFIGMAHIIDSAYKGDFSSFLPLMSTILPVNWPRKRLYDGRLAQVSWNCPGNMKLS